MTQLNTTSPEKKLECIVFALAHSEVNLNQLSADVGVRDGSAQLDRVSVF